jgi:hypothetical protein
MPERHAPHTIKSKTSISNGAKILQAWKNNKSEKLRNEVQNSEKNQKLKLISKGTQDWIKMRNKALKE